MHEPVRIKLKPDLSIIKSRTRAHPLRKISSKTKNQKHRRAIWYIQFLQIKLNHA